MPAKTKAIKRAKRKPRYASDRQALRTAVRNFVDGDGDDPTLRAWYARRHLLGLTVDEIFRVVESAARSA